MIYKSLKSRLSPWKTVLGIATIALLLNSNSAQAQLDPGIPDTVKVGSVQVNAGDHFGVPVRFFNDEPLAGGTLGFSWGTTDLNLDSISYVGSRLIADAARITNSSIDNVNSRGLSGFFVILEPPVPPGEGHFATFWFTADAGAADQIITIDSALFPPSGDFILISDEQVSIEPQFVSGTVTIGNPQTNTPPALATIGPQSVNEGQSLDFRIFATDAESTPTLSALNLPLNSSIVDSGNGAGSFSFSPDFDQAGQFNVTFIASDGEFADTEVVTVTVNNTNRPPNLAFIGNRNVDEGANLNFMISATDPDGDSLFFSVSPPLPSNATLTDNHNGTATVDFSPDFNQAGQTFHSFRVTDENNASAIEPISITVNNVNRAPVIAAVEAQSVDAGDSLTFSVTSSDPDGNSPFLMATDLPLGAFFWQGINQSVGEFRWQPVSAQAGQHSATFVTTDNDLSDTLVVIITVVDVNLSPVLTSILPQVVNEGDTLFLRITATDPNGTTPGLGTGPLPPNATFVDSGNGAGLLTFAPDFTQSGNVEVTFTATDGALTDSAVVIITVNNVNRAPIISSIGPRTVTAGDSLVFQIISFDPDGTLPSLTAALLPTGAILEQGINPSFGDFRWLPTAAQVGDHIAFFVATDGSLADSESVTITVTEAPVVDSAFVTPDTLFFTLQEGSVIDTAFDSVTITSTNNGNFTVSASGPPLFTFPQSGAGTTPGDNFITVFSFGLTAGVYTNTLTYNVDGVSNNPLEVAVILTVTEPAAPDSAFVAPDTLFFTIDEATDVVLTGCAFLSSTNAPAPFTGVVWPTPTDPAPPEADTAHSPFTTLIDATGMTNDSVCIQVSAGGLIPGKYYNDIFFTVEGVDNNTVWLVACLTVTAGQIPDSAFFSPDTLFFSFEFGFADTIVLAASFLTSTNAPSPWFAPIILDTMTVFFPADTSGLTNDSVHVYITHSGLSVGTHFRSLDYHVDGVDNNPIRLFASVTITPPQPDTSRVGISDTLFVFESIAGTPFIGGDSLRIFHVGPGPEVPWILGATDCFFISPQGDTITTRPPVTWVSISPTAGTTPEYAFISVDNELLEPGKYICDYIADVDTTFIVDPQPFRVILNVGSASPDSSILAISDSIFIFNSSIDTPFVGSDSLGIFNVGSGPEFPWEIVELGWFFIPDGIDTVIFGVVSPWASVSPRNGVTPGFAFISVDNEGLGAGKHVTQYLVGSPTDLQPIGSPRLVEIVLNVAPTPQGPLSIIEVSDSMFHYQVVEGDSVEIRDSVMIFNTGDGPEFGWRVSDVSCFFAMACDTLIDTFIVCLDTCGDTLFDTLLCPDTCETLIETFVICDTLIVFDTVLQFFDTLSGITPSTLRFGFNTQSLLAGSYFCQFVIEADSGVLNSPRIIQAELQIDSKPPEPSGDTLFVSTVPGTPGSKVKVPVNMINQGPLCSLFVNLEWGSAQIFLDSISFVGTRLEGIASTRTTIDNGGRTLSIDFTAENIAMPAGSGKIANLYFDIFSDITESGVVPIALNSKPACPACVLTAHNCMMSITPQFFPGGIVIDSSANVICGRVIDTAGNEIPGATVQIWDNFPQGTLFAEQTTRFDGSFKFQQLFVVPYTVYAYAEGFYPGVLEDINFGSLGLEVVLTPVSPIQPTNEWVDFFCGENFYKGVPLPVGSVVDAFDPDGDHVGTWFVTEEGRYGLMPVYRDDPFTEEDDGADPGDTITFYINGIPAETTGERVWTQNGDRFEVCLNFDGSVDKTICLQNGWNLISWNVDTEVDDISALFGSFMQYVDVILSFEEVGLTYDPDLPDFSTLTSADHIHGYWVRIENFPGECVELNLAGLPVLVNTPIHLETGWNLVSYLPTVSLPTSSALVSQEGNLRVALGFNGEGLTYEPDLPEFSTLTTMAPCFGYWLKVFEPGALIYPGFNSAPLIDSDENTGQSLLAKLGLDGKLVPTNNWIDIYSSKLTLDGQPARAGQSVSAIATDGSLVGYGVVSGGGKLMFTPVYGAEDGEAGGIKPGQSFTLMIGATKTNESFVFSGRGERLEIGPLTSKGSDGPIVPDSYSLSQNYPNPFNPSTKIRFTLPNASEVSLEIFNILGARIVTLAAGEYPAGETVVEWDGRNSNGSAVATGIYFYRLKAGSFVQTRKMALLK